MPPRPVSTQFRPRTWAWRLGIAFAGALVSGALGFLGGQSISPGPETFESMGGPRLHVSAPWLSDQIQANDPKRFSERKSSRPDAVSDQRTA